MEISGRICYTQTRMQISQRVLLFLSLVFCFAAFRPEVVTSRTRVLFIGNSYTFYPQDPSKPGVPYFVQQIAQSIDPKTAVIVDSNTIPNASMEVHYNDSKSRALMNGSYDEVILQGRSTDPLRVPQWFQKQGFLGLESFQIFLPKVLQLIRQHCENITMYVPWAYHPKHAYFRNLQGEFENAKPREWKGESGADLQDLVDQGYVRAAGDTPVQFSFVGDTFEELVDFNVVKRDDLYRKEDWSHPSVLGSMIAALVLTRDVLHLDVEANTFVPEGLTRAQVETISQVISRSFHTGF